MVFKFDFSNASTGGLKDGTYEVFIQSMTESATQSGTVYINVPLVVRNDIEQKGKNGLIFHRIWQKKKDGKYPRWALDTIGKFARMDENKEYKTLEDVFDDLTLKPVKVTVKNEISEYNGKTYNNLNVKRWDYTDYPNLAHTFKDDTQASSNNSPFENVEVSEDDLPF